MFASIFEHHSNLLPWREIGAKIVLVPEKQDGCLDIELLELELVRYSGSGLKMIGTFCAASNITGQLNDDLVNFLFNEGTLYRGRGSTACVVVNPL